MAAAWRGEAAFRQEVVLAIFSIPLAVLIAPDVVSMMLMIGSILMLMTVELLNTAVEATVDRIGLHRDNLAKKAKDTASAAVLIAIVNAVMVWAVVLVSLWLA